MTKSRHDSATRTGLLLCSAAALAFAWADAAAAQDTNQPVPPPPSAGHPQADVFLLKYAPAPSEIEEGVAFYGRAGSALCSGASSRSKTRSAEATPDCRMLAIDATWVSGWVNCREYWMKAWTSPSDMLPDATRRPPTTATAT